MDEWFLERAKAKLEIAKLLGFLDRWIKLRLRETSDGDLWTVRREFHKDCWRLAALENPTGKNPSMGSRYRVYAGHSFRRYLDAEDSRRCDEWAEANPDKWKTPFDDLSNEDLDHYIAWRRDKPPDEVDKLGVEERFILWRKERPRVLPIIPKSGSLPSQANVRRPNHQERSRDLAKVPAAKDPKEVPPKDGGTEEGVSFEIQDREVH
jgi:hypothetical protein